MPKSGKAVGSTLSARFTAGAALQSLGGHPNASFDGWSSDLGAFGAASIDRAQALREGLPLASFAGRRKVDREVDLLVRRLAAHGLLEYRLGSDRGSDQVVI